MRGRCNAPSRVHPWGGAFPGAAKSSCSSSPSFRRGFARTAPPQYVWDASPSVSGLQTGCVQNRARNFAKSAIYRLRDAGNQPGGRLPLREPAGPLASHKAAKRPRRFLRKRPGWCAYGVTHTTLGRYFERPEMKAQLRQLRQQLRAEQQALAAARAAERRLEPEIRRKAAEQAAREREQERGFRADWAEYWSRRSLAYTEEDAWRDERNAPRRPETRADLHNTNDVIAARVVGAGGGLQAVIEATELPTLNSISDLDPVIVTRAYDNDRRERTRPPVTVRWQRRPRRLLPEASARPAAAAAPGGRRAAKAARPRLRRRPHHTQPLLRPARGQQTTPPHRKTAQGGAAARTPHAAPPQPALKSDPLTRALPVASKRLCRSHAWPRRCLARLTQPQDFCSLDARARIPQPAVSR